MFIVKTILVMYNPLWIIIDLSYISLISPKPLTAVDISIRQQVCAFHQHKILPFFWMW